MGTWSEQFASTTIITHLFVLLLIHLYYLLILNIHTYIYRDRHLWMHSIGISSNSIWHYRPQLLSFLLSLPRCVCANSNILLSSDPPKSSLGAIVCACLIYDHLFLSFLLFIHLFSILQYTLLSLHRSCISRLSFLHTRTSTLFSICLSMDWYIYYIGFSISVFLTWFLGCCSRRRS